ncbi:F-type H+-transporting ATPase subunit d, partial [Phenoliferia sp. Uapishka_3]
MVTSETQLGAEGCYLTFTHRWAKERSSPPHPTIKMSKTAQVVVDWSRISTKLGLHKGESSLRPSDALHSRVHPIHHSKTQRTDTLAALGAFRKRAAEARLHNSQLKDAKVEIDFEHYRNILKNREVVAEGEKIHANFKPVDYDVSAQLKTIAAFESKAIESAKQAATKIDAELADLSSTLKNIEDARPFNQLTLDDVSKARPEVTHAVESMIKNGKWTVPGYTESAI